MNEFIHVSKKIVPDIIEIMELRYDILRKISQNNSIGRRKLSQQLNIPERIARSEIDFLKQKNLVLVENSGVRVSNKGYELLEEMEDYILDIKGLSDLSTQVKNLLNLKSVMIVPGDASKDSENLKIIGKKAGELLIKNLKSGTSIGLTGGSSVMEVSNQLEYINRYKDILVFPARGGLGEELETQANTISAKMAEKFNGKYKLFYLPDNLEPKLLETLKGSTYTKDMEEYLEKMDLLVFGIGIGSEMAKKRNLPKREMALLEKKKCVSEALGYFFDIDGKLVLETNTIGIDIEKFREVENLIGVAGGSEKGKAIVSISKLNKNINLVIDEGAASEIIKIMNDN